MPTINVDLTRLEITKREIKNYNLINTDVFRDDSKDDRNVELIITDDPDPKPDQVLDKTMAEEKISKNDDNAQLKHAESSEDFIPGSKLQTHFSGIKKIATKKLDLNPVLVSVLERHTTESNDASELSGFKSIFKPEPFSEKNELFSKKVKRDIAAHDDLKIEIASSDDLKIETESFPISTTGVQLSQEFSIQI